MNRKAARFNLKKLLVLAVGAVILGAGVTASDAVAAGNKRPVPGPGQPIPGFNPVDLARTMSLVGDTAGAPNLLRVLSVNYNSEVTAFDDSNQSMRTLRFDALVDFVRAASVDVVLIQEGWKYKDAPSVAIPLARVLGYDYFYRIDLGFPFLMYDSDIILAKKELHLKSTWVTQLPHSAPHIGNSTTWIIPFGAISYAVGGELTLPNGQGVFISSTHLLGSSDADRDDQVVALDSMFKSKVAAAGVPWEQANVIYGGDFNSDPGSPEILHASKLGYTETWSTVHADYMAAHPDGAAGNTFCGAPRSAAFDPLTIGAGQLPAQDEPQKDTRYDYIFSKGPALRPVASTAVFTQPYGGFWLSDHYSVLTTFAYGDAPAVPNPLNDSDGGPGPDRTVRLDDDAFSQCDRRIDCDLVLENPVTVGSARGLAVTYKGGDKMYVKITGPGRVFPADSTTLTNAQAVAFVFMKPGAYSMKIIDSVGDSLTVPLSVSPSALTMPEAWNHRRGD